MRRHNGQPEGGRAGQHRIAAQLSRLCSRRPRAAVCCTDRCVSCLCRCRCSRRRRGGPGRTRGRGRGRSGGERGKEWGGGDSRGCTTVAARASMPTPRWAVQRIVLITVRCVNHDGGVASLNGNSNLLRELSLPVCARQQAVGRLHRRDESAQDRLGALVPAAVCRHHKGQTGLCAALRNTPISTETGMQPTDSETDDGR